MVWFRYGIVPLALMPGTPYRHRCFKVRLLVWIEMHESVTAIIRYIHSTDSLQPVQVVPDCFLAVGSIMEQETAK